MGDETISPRSSRKRRLTGTSQVDQTCPGAERLENELVDHDERGVADCEEDSDDVEFLYTNPPPPQTMRMAGDCREQKRNKAVSPIVPVATNSECPVSSNNNANEQHSEKRTNGEGDRGSSAPIGTAPTASPAPLAPRSEWVSPLAARTPPVSSFPHRKSAYLQSLAEICHAVLWDARWRVGGSRERRLFEWERGDDMTALFTLARRYRAHEETLLVGIDAQGSNEAVGRNQRNETDRKGRMGSDKDNDYDSNKIVIEEDNDGHPGFEDDGSDPDDRCLETYARLYFRKGPWFRLDNVYASYYLPQKRKVREHPVASELSSNAMDASTDPLATTAVDKTPVSSSNFFARRSNETGSNSKPPKRKRILVNENDYIDREFVDLQMENVVVLLEDIKRLLKMGLIRSFHNEEECGRAVGKRTGKYDYTAVCLLRQDEQRTVLAKLGGGQKQKSAVATKTNSYHSSTVPTIAETNQQSSENLIWKQMCQQQTIFFSFNNHSRGPVLPVIKHVHQLLVEKWASSIVLRASKVEYVPSAILRSATKSVCDALLELTSAATIGSTIVCLRLREAPLLTLRRACRLYLCATSGPGDMRNSGTNAWRSFPGSHAKDLQKLPLRTNVVSPPGSSWNTVCYPGKDWRLRVVSCSFIRAYKPAVVGEFRQAASPIHDAVVGKDGDERTYLGNEAKGVGDTVRYDEVDGIQVFSGVQAFQQWELGVEIRENCDFLLELNDLLLYNERKRARESQSVTTNDLKNQKGIDEDNGGASEDSSSESTDSVSEIKDLDFQDLLTIGGRAKLIRGLLAVSKEDCKALFSEIERDVSILLAIPLCDRPLSTLIEQTDKGTGMPQFAETNRIQNLDNDCERILGVIGIILTHALEYRTIHDRAPEARSIFNRPWLRHMYWEGCMSYVLWDIIPIMERRGYYNFAINALEVLLFGKRLPRATNKLIPHNFCVDSKTSQFDFGHSYSPLISRRARGKAFDRLIIDYTHFVRKNNITTQVVESKKTRQKTSMRKGSTKQKRNASPTSIVHEVVPLLTEPILQTCVPSGQISFSSIRTLARRLKRPLSSSLEGLKSFEISELGHRICNGDYAHHDMTKYNDWTPIFDNAVANAMGTDRESNGGRCSFIGFEEDDHAVRMGSLNVEELAMEYYHQGRLPVSDDSGTKGGWIGYHDEGGKIRALFRILSSSILGMDWESKAHVTSEASTIHLTPYQGAPFDLHVGAEQIGSGGLGCKGIYFKRKSAIDEFLGKLSCLDGEELSDFVHDCINDRVKYTNSFRRIDPSLNSDLKQARTLSMIAAGLGGKMLSSIFRCLFFDYRHYSGGLPDLLLVRALYSSSATEGQPSIEHHCKGELVDLGEWVGEEFSCKHQDALKAKQVAQIFMDTDGDFLGCSKVGDSGGRAKNRFQRSGRWRNSVVQEVGNTNADKQTPSYLMPEKLLFCHDSRQVRVECMFVEVKSQNDRLDSRQEDWLNILDQHGNARVCKFGKIPKT